MLIALLEVTDKLLVFFPQVGTQWMITAAHCVHDNKKDKEDVIELLPTNSLSVLLGLHDKSLKKEELR